MSIGRTVYNALFRRTSTFAVTIVIGAFAFERVFDEGMDNLWENMNRGVSYNCLQYKLCTVPKFAVRQSKTVSTVLVSDDFIVTWTKGFIDLAAEGQLA